MKWLKNNKKTILSFLKTLVISLLVFEIVEYILVDTLGYDIFENLSPYGYIGFVIAQGFKYHIWCCLLPLIYSSYKCRHDKECDHDYCNKN